MGLSSGDLMLAGIPAKLTLQFLIASLILREPDHKVLALMACNVCNSRVLLSAATSICRENLKGEDPLSLPLPLSWQMLVAADNRSGGSQLRLSMHCCASDFRMAKVAMHGVISTSRCIQAADVPLAAQLSWHRHDVGHDTCTQLVFLLFCETSYKSTPGKASCPELPMQCIHP